MSLPHAILTALTERAGSGLDLARRFDRSIGYFWSASHQQIYRELTRLEEAGLIESEPVPNTRGQKRQYRVLPSGQDELRRWIPLQEDAAPLRDALMVRMRAEAALGDGDLASALRYRLAQHHETLTRYRDIEARDFPTAPRSKSQALRHLILTAGIRHETNWIELLEEALGFLDRSFPD